MSSDATDLPSWLSSSTVPWGQDRADADLRRRLGPMAWMVLGEIDDSARRVDGEVCAAVSIRALAAELGLSKNAVHRAVRRLRDLGVILDHRQAQSSSGQYGTSYYVVAAAREAHPSRRRQAQPTLHARRAPNPEHRQVEQLTLFPAS